MMKLFSMSLCTVASLLLITACGQKGPVKRSWGKMKGLDKIVCNMNDVSYSSGRTQKPRSNALGKPVSITQFKGKFIWAEYAAPWCQPCNWQAPETKKVEKTHGEAMVFLTVMTSNSTKYNDHASVATAQKWAATHKLPKSRVLAAELWAKTIPEHRFYSPEGHTLFVHVGALTADQIREVIAFYKSGYEDWKKTGEPADWMTFP